MDVRPLLLVGLCLSPTATLPLGEPEAELRAAPTRAGVETTRQHEFFEGSDLDRCGFSVSGDIDFDGLEDCWGLGLAPRSAASVMPGTRCQGLPAEAPLHTV